mmetsp:Transcript_28671/g.25650  ORF Transcript_28671/g.25650 Transcript_28671/m.25650 type:complete len:118 (-) Transcript_28671:613-966(-)
MYPDEDDICRSCQASCRTCSSSTVGSCLTCFEGTVYFKGICLNECPPSYSLDVTKKICQEDISSTAFLGVDIIEIDYADRVPHGDLVKLRVAINDSLNNVTSIEWNHLEDPSISEAN